MPGAAAIVFIHNQSWSEKVGTLIRQFSRRLTLSAVSGLRSSRLMRSSHK